MQNIKYDPSKVVEVPKVEYVRKPVYDFFKRLFDLVVSLIAFLILSPILLILTVLVATTSKGGAIFKQERLGKNGKPFMMYKFRSMRADAEKDGAQWAQKDDPRVTKVGKFLRKVRLDELPQLVNIILGQMSIVGPRPERSVFYDEFEKTIHGFRQRLLVTPGLTGWAQVNGGYDLGPEDKIFYDLEYIEKRSLGFDMKCILRTLKTIFFREGAR